MPNITKNNAPTPFPGIAVSLAYWLSVSLFFLGVHFDWPQWRLATKVLPVLIIGVAVGRAMPPTQVRLPLLAALFLCAVGDLLLEALWLPTAPPLPWFAMGLSAFLLAHLAFLVAFLRLGVQPRLRAIVLLPWTIGLLLVLWPQLGPTQAPVAVYVAVITAMMAAALSMDYNDANRHLRWLLVAGAVTFGISDSVIAINRFLTPVPEARYWISTTYWVATICIPVALVRMTVKHSAFRYKTSG